MESLRGSGARWPIAPRLRLVPDVVSRGPSDGHLVDAPGFIITESCIFRAVMSGVMGGAMGAFFGAVFSGYGSLAPYDPALRDWQASALAKQRADAVAHAAAEAAAAKAAGRPVPVASFPAQFPGLHLPNTALGEPPSIPLRQHLIEGLYDMKTRAISQGKTFAIVGGIYSCVECSLEHVRGKKDMKGAIVSGFVTGATLSARAGPQAALLGGAGFAAFSIAIELLSPLIFDH